MILRTAVLPDRPALAKGSIAAMITSDTRRAALISTRIEQRYNMRFYIAEANNNQSVKGIGSSRYKESKTRVKAIGEVTSRKVRSIPVTKLLCRFETKMVRALVIGSIFWIPFFGVAAYLLYDLLSYN